MDEREAFELWWTRDKSGDEQRAGIDLMRESIDHEGEYNHLRIQTAWEAWKARATLTAPPPASTNRLTDEQILDLAGKFRRHRKAGAIHYEWWEFNHEDYLISFVRAILAATEAKP